MNERLNIRRMQVPESKSEAEMPFDPMRDITVEDWNDIVTSYGKSSTGGHESLELRACAQFLNPSLSVALSEQGGEYWPTLDHDVKNQRDTKRWPDFFWSVMLIRQVDPTHAPIIADEERAEARKELLRLCDIDHWSSAAILAQAMRLTTNEPEKERLTSPHMDGMRSGAEGIKHAAPAEFARIAATIKIVDVSREIPLSQEDWRMLKRSLDNLRHGAVRPGFCKLARDLYILAGEVEILDAPEGQTLVIKPRKGGAGKGGLIEQVRAMPESPSLPQ